MAQLSCVFFLMFSGAFSARVKVEDVLAKDVLAKDAKEADTNKATYKCTDAVLEPPAPAFQGFEYVGYPMPQATNPPGQQPTAGRQRSQWASIPGPFAAGRQLLPPANPNAEAIDLNAFKYSRPIQFTGFRHGSDDLKFSFQDPDGRFKAFMQKRGVDAGAVDAMLNEVSQKTSGKSGRSKQNKACKEAAAKYNDEWHSQGKLSGHEIICYTWGFFWKYAGGCEAYHGEGVDGTDWDHHIVVRKDSATFYMEGNILFNRFCCCKPGGAACKFKYQKTSTKCNTGTFSTTHSEQAGDDKCTRDRIEPGLMDGGVFSPTSQGAYYNGGGDYNISQVVTGSKDYGWYVVPNDGNH